MLTPVTGSVTAAHVWVHVALNKQALPSIGRQPYPHMSVYPHMFVCIGPHLTVDARHAACEVVVCDVQ